MVGAAKSLSYCPRGVLLGQKGAEHRQEVEASRWVGGVSLEGNMSLATPGLEAKVRTLDWTPRRQMTLEGCLLEQRMVGAV